MAIDWSRTWTVRWRVFRVDPSTWANAGEVAGVDSVSVKRDSAGASPLVDSGGMVVTGDRPAAGYYRIVADVTQDGTMARESVATLLFEGTGGTADHGRVTHEMDGRSVLWPAAVDLLPFGAYVGAGVDAARYAAGLLSRSVAAPVRVEGDGFRLAVPVTHEPGDSALDAAWQVLRMGGHGIRIEGDGTVVVRPDPTEPALSLDAAGAGLLRTGIQYTADYSDVPTEYVAVDEHEAATATNDDPASPTSSVARGYAVRVVDESPSPLEGETLGAYAARRLREESTVRETRTYKRKWVPGVLPGDLVRGSMPSVLLDGDMRVTSQSLAVGGGIEVTERAQMEVVTWT